MSSLPPDAVPSEIEPPGLEPEHLGGHTLDELSDYLDSGESPADPSIDGSPGAQIALQSLRRVRQMASSLLESDAHGETGRDDTWITGILSAITMESRAGRDIPVSHTASNARLVITEGSVRGMIRAAADQAGGLLIGRIRLEGDVTTPGEPITILVDASAFWGEPIAEAAARLREAIYSELLKHTELQLNSIDVTVHDVYRIRSTTTDEVEQS